MIWDTDLKGNNRKSSSFIATVAAALLLFVLALLANIMILDAATREASIHLQETEKYVSGTIFGQEQRENADGLFILPDLPGDD